MYLPKHFEENRLPVLHDLIDANPLGILVMQTSEGLNANHVPFELDRDGSEKGVLRAHIARANPFWNIHSPGSESLVIFQGADTYVTPSWYPTKQLTGKAVPTWAYAVTHAYGDVRFVHDADWLRGLVERLSNRHETGREQPWQVADAPADYIERLLGAIVGIEITIERMYGKWKLDQNKQASDRSGVAQALLREDDARKIEIGRLISSSGVDA